MVTIIKHFAVNLKPNSLLTPNFKTKYSLSVPVGLVTLVVPDSKGSSIVLGFLNLTLRLRTMLGLDVILYAVRKQRGEITKLGRESVNTGKGKRKKHPSFGVHTVICRGSKFKKSRRILLTLSLPNFFIYPLCFLNTYKITSCPSAVA